MMSINTNSIAFMKVVSSNVVTKYIDGMPIKSSVSRVAKSLASYRFPVFFEDGKYFVKATDGMFEIVFDATMPVKCWIEKVS